MSELTFPGHYMLYYILLTHSIIVHKTNTSLPVKDKHIPFLATACNAPFIQNSQYILLVRALLIRNIALLLPPGGMAGAFTTNLIETG